MRVLRFIVNKQIVKQDPNCDFTDLVPGTEGYLQAEFSFSQEWDGCVKVIEFWSNDEECPPQVLTDGKTCEIPAQALAAKYFELRVLGKSDELRLSTNLIKVRQNGGRR